jgi:hypothetical protein
LSAWRDADRDRSAFARIVAVREGTSGLTRCRGILVKDLDRAGIGFDRKKNPLMHTVSIKDQSDSPYNCLLWVVSSAKKKAPRPAGVDDMTRKWRRQNWKYAVEPAASKPVLDLGAPG